MPRILQLHMISCLESCKYLFEHVNYVRLAKSEVSKTSVFVFEICFPLCTTLLFIFIFCMRSFSEVAHSLHKLGILKVSEFYRFEIEK